MVELLFGNFQIRALPLLYRLTSSGKQEIVISIPCDPDPLLYSRKAFRRLTGPVPLREILLSI